MPYKLTCLKDESGATRGTLVCFDNCTFLIDPSWSGRGYYDDCLKFWKEWVSQLDIILLSQPTQDCIGAYAMLYYEFTTHFKSRIQVYSTLPIANLGRVVTVDLYASKGIIGPYDTNRMDIEDIETAFDHINTVKYSQLVDLKNKFDGLGLVAYSSGFAPGGVIWCINNYSEKFLYAPRWNHTRDTILNSADLLDKTGKPSSALMRPSVVLTCTENVSPSIPYRKRSLKFKEIVKKALVSNSSVVIPTAIGGKFLELFVLINDLLYETKKSDLQSDVPVLLISYSRGRTLTYAKSMLEWMSSQLVKTWVSRDNKSPFDMGNRLKIVPVSKLSNYPGTKICFVSQVDTLTNDVISKICTKEKALLLLTEKPNSGSQNIPILNKAYDKWERAISTSNFNATEGNPIVYSESMAVQFIKTKPLTGDDLSEFQSRIENRSRQRSEILASFQTTEHAANNGSAFSDDDDDGDDDVLRSSVGGALSAKIEIPMDILISSSITPKHKMFPFQPGKVSRDDYGDLVDFEQFLTLDGGRVKRNADQFEDEEEGYDPHEFENPNKHSTVGIRRRGDPDPNQSHGNNDDLSYLETNSSPQQRVVSHHKVTVRCSMAFVDLSGLVDSRSLSIIWPALKPRKMVLTPVAESHKETWIATQLQRKGLDVIDAQFNKDLTINTTLKSLDVLIDVEMDQSLRWQRISDGYVVAHVAGRLVREKDAKLSHREKLILKPLSNHPSRVQTGGTLRIGDVRLAELKRNLTAQSHVAEFKGEGTLVVDGQVVVRKIGESEAIVDGIPSDLFYKVKAAVADMLAKV
ncbi:HBR074Wp [Eremothecium sinecaudum]|uniref:Cleavage and polyadenylation specificity factor subunit 2 n=1 Tax=Eremothecium sinecaudum TaxID=45286 RepID=A0A120K140_9SACH|nr:HBR074Wp [Eremothecium sinecaudum]AMD18975.1 HBR074Wp [Eremothecium sinecaudum]